MASDVDTSTDSTAYSRAEEALRNSEALYHSLVESLPQNIFRKDRAGRFTFGNQKFFNTLGKSPEETLGKTDFDFFPAELARKYRQDDERVMATGEIFEAVEEHQRPNGEKLYVQVVKTPVYDARGGVIGTQGIFWDVTERHRAEAELQSALQKLEQANLELAEVSRTKSEFLANTSHELRTPLTSIIGYLNLVLDGLTDNAEEAMDFVRTARDSSKHLLTLINDVLDLAKIEAGKMAIAIEEVNLNDALIHAHALTHVQAAQKKIRLQFDIPPEPILVKANADKVKQVLLNLVGNAVKFTKHGSVSVSACAEGEFARVCIKDTGIGISKGAQKRLFQPFVQADGSTTRRFGGTGLGLAITKSLVEKMGGRISLHSEGEGKGVVVEFTLPLSPLPVAPLPGASEQPAQSCLSKSKVRALIADDDPATVRFIQRLLSKDRYETHTVENGADVINHLERGEAVEVLILDLMMPGISGYDVLALLNHKYGAPPPVVIVTNYADNVSPEQQRLLEGPFVKAIIPKAQVYEKLPSYLERLFRIDQPVGIS